MLSTVRAKTIERSATEALRIFISAGDFRYKSRLCSIDYMRYMRYMRYMGYMRYIDFTISTIYTDLKYGMIFTVKNKK